MNRSELLEDRLSRLERQNHRIKVLLVIACVFALMPFLLAATQQKPDVNADNVYANLVFAKSYYFSDPSDGGRTRTPFHLMMTTVPDRQFDGLQTSAVGLFFGADLVASFKYGPKGTGFLVYNIKGMNVASLYAQEDGGGVGVDTKDGKGSAYLIATPDGGRLNIGGSEGKNVAVLAAVPGNASRLSMYGQGTLTAMLGSDSDGGLFRLLTRSGNTSVVLNTSYGGQIGVLNSQGMVAGALGVNPHGDGSFIVNNKEGKMTGWLTTAEDGSSGGFQLRRPDGSVVFHAP